MEGCRFPVLRGGHGFQDRGEDSHDKRLSVRPLWMLAKEGGNKVKDPEGNADASVDRREEDVESLERLARN